MSCFLDFGTLLLSICPCLREYGNISYNKQSQVNNNNNNGTTTNQMDSSLNHQKIEISKLKNCSVVNQPIMPSLTLDEPD